MTDKSPRSADRHGRAPVSVRLSAPDLERLAAHAAHQGITPHAALKRAVAEYLDRADEAAAGQCPHPAGRVIKGFCGACGGPAPSR